MLLAAACLPQAAVLCHLGSPGLIQKALFSLIKPQQFMTLVLDR